MILLNYFVYYLFILPVSMLPYPLLYALSDFLYYLLYYVLGYRKKVVMMNIQNSFPEMTRLEHLAIAKRFYRHFCDLILESLKVFTISREEVRKRMVVKNASLINDYFEQGRNVIVAGGHYNNWELFAVGIDEPIKHHAIAIYKPLNNLFFDIKMRATRGKYGLRMISTKIVKSVFEEDDGKLTATIFGIDQSPSPLKCHWMKFLNQDTGVLFGTEKYAKEYNYPVIFGQLTKEKRGHYSLEFFKAFDEPALTKHGEITEKITHMLERQIIDKPEFWLWTHKRWKHQMPAHLPSLQ